MGGHGILCPPRLKKWGDTSPVSPTKLRPWLQLQHKLVHFSSKLSHLTECHKPIVLTVLSCVRGGHPRFLSLFSCSGWSWWRHYSSKMSAFKNNDGLMNLLLRSADVVKRYCCRTSFFPSGVVAAYGCINFLAPTTRTKVVARTATATARLPCWTQRVTFCRRSSFLDCKLFFIVFVDLAKTFDTASRYRTVCNLSCLLLQLLSTQTWRIQ